MPHAEPRSHLKMMQTPRDWPVWPFLPLKRWNPVNRQYDTAVLRETGRLKFKVAFNTSLYAMTATAQWEDADPQELVTDGWEVD